MATKARIAITAENNISKGLLESKRDLMEWEQSVQRIGKAVSAAFNVGAIALAIKGVTSFASTATNALNKLATSSAKVAKDVTKISASWVKGYEDMRLSYERLRLSLNNEKDYEYVVNSIDTLARSTTIAKDEIEAMVSELAQLGKSAKEIDKISRASVYLSTVTGRDLNSSMTTLLATYNGITTQLNKLGMNMNKYTKEELQAGAAVDDIINKYQTLNDQIASNSLSQSFADIKEAVNTVRDAMGATVADLIGPTTKKIADAVNELTDLFGDISGRMDFQGLVGLVRTFVKSLSKQFTDALTSNETYTKITSFVSKLVKAIVPILTTGIVMAISAAKAAMSSVNLVDAQSKVNKAQQSYDAYKEELKAKYGVDELSKGWWLTLWEEKRLQGYIDAINKAENAVGNLTDRLISNITDAIEPGMKYIGTELPKAFETCADAAKDLKEVVPGIWETAFDEADAYLREYRQSLNKIAPEIGRNNTNISVGPKYTFKGNDPVWYAKMLVNTTMTQDSWNDLANKLNQNVIPRITAPLVEVKSTQQTMAESWDSFLQSDIGEIISISKDDNAIMKKYYQDFAEYMKNPPVDENLMQIVEQGRMLDSSYDDLKKYLFGYTAKVTETDENGNMVTTDQFISGIFNGYGQKEANFLGEEFDNLVSSLGIFGDMIIGINPTLAVLKPVIEGFASVMAPMIETVLLPLQSTLTYIGELIAGLFAPILDKIAPVFQFIANVLMMVIQPVLALMQAPLLVIATLLEFLSPLLNVFGKVIEYLMIPLNAFAATIEWMGAWIRFIVLGIYNAFAWIWGGTQDNPTPGSWSSYYDNLKSKTQWTDVGSTNLITDYSQDLINGTSTSTGVTNASYQGSGTVTINIYQNAPVVGSAGMEEFAIMLRKEFEAIGYYNVA